MLAWAINLVIFASMFCPSGGRKCLRRSKHDSVLGVVVPCFVAGLDGVISINPGPASVRLTSQLWPKMCAPILRRICMSARPALGFFPMQFSPPCAVLVWLIKVRRIRKWSSGSFNRRTVQKFHSGRCKTIKNSGHTLWYLLPNSPDLNQIERKWARAKARRRKTGTSTEQIFGSELSG